MNENVENLEIIIQELIHDRKENFWKAIEICIFNPHVTNRNLSGGCFTESFTFESEARSSELESLLMIGNYEGLKQRLDDSVKSGKVKKLTECPIKAIKSTIEVHSVEKFLILTQKMIPRNMERLNISHRIILLSKYTHRSVYYII